LFVFQNFQNRLKKLDWSRLKKIDKRLIDKITSNLEKEMAALIESARKIDDYGEAPLR
jgi:hypothetical protein